MAWRPSSQEYGKWGAGRMCLKTRNRDQRGRSETGFTPCWIGISVIAQRWRVLITMTWWGQHVITVHFSLSLRKHKTSSAQNGGIFRCEGRMPSFQSKPLLPLARSSVQLLIWLHIQGIIWTTLLINTPHRAFCIGNCGISHWLPEIKGIQIYLFRIFFTSFTY